MDNHKLHVWILLLLVWNAVLLMFLIAHLLLKPQIGATPDQTAAACRAATLEAIGNSCSNL